MQLLSLLDLAGDPGATVNASTIFSFHRVSNSEVKETIMNMPSNKSPGHDKVSMKVIKICLPHILSVVTDLINTSIVEGCFPNVWKLAEVVPPHLKEGDHEIASNNRPISRLCCRPYRKCWSALRTSSLSVTSPQTSFQSIKAEIRNCIQQKLLEYYSPANCTRLSTTTRLRLPCC